MTKKSIVEREDKRTKLVSMYKSKYNELKKIAKSAKHNLEQRRQALKDLQKIPRNANPFRLRSRCGITGRPRGTFRQFGLGRTKIREMAFNGLIPGITKSSW